MWDLNLDIEGNYWPVVSITEQNKACANCFFFR